MSSIATPDPFSISIYLAISGRAAAEAVLVRAMDSIADALRQAMAEGKARVRRCPDCGRWVALGNE